MQVPNWLEQAMSDASKEVESWPEQMRGPELTEIIRQKNECGPFGQAEPKRTPRA
jgi:hypothetical protein